MTDLETMRAFLKRRSGQRQAALAARLAEAKRDFDRIVDYLVREYGPKRIYQWGSLVDGEYFSEISDIDVAVEGLGDPLAGLDAAAGAQLLSSLPVDLVELERIHPLHAESYSTGVETIFERVSQFFENDLSSSCVFDISKDTTLRSRMTGSASMRS